MSVITSMCKVEKKESGELNFLFEVAIYFVFMLRLGCFSIHTFIYIVLCKHTYPKIHLLMVNFPHSGGHKESFYLSTLFLLSVFS